MLTFYPESRAPALELANAIALSLPGSAPQAAARRCPVDILHAHGNVMDLQPVAGGNLGEPYAAEIGQSDDSHT
jgi:hypothetical protein